MVGLLVPGQCRAAYWVEWSPVSSLRLPLAQSTSPTSTWETVAVVSRRQHLIALALVCIAGLLGLLGRWSLDRLVSLAPDWAPSIERFGGWAIGMLIGVVVVLPLLRVYGVFGERPQQDR
jgi:hypothetical protein